MAHNVSKVGISPNPIRLRNASHNAKIVRSPHVQQAFLVVSDMVTLIVSFTVAISYLQLTAPHRLMGVEGRATGIIGILWIITLWLTGTYSVQQLRAGATEYKRAINATIVAGGITGIMCYLLNYGYPRVFFGTWMLVGAAFLCLTRLARRRIMHQLHMRGLFISRVIIVGEIRHIEELVTVLRRETWIGYQVGGAITDDLSRSNVSGVPVLGSLADLSSVVRSQDIQAVVLAEGSFQSSSEFRRFAWQLEQSHIDIILAPTLTDISAERLECRPVAGLPLLHVVRPTGLRSLSGLKRAVDIAGSALLLLLLSPLLLAVMIAIKLEDGGPVLFRQRRIGLNGTFFDCLKLRSMCVDAEAKLAVLEERSEGNGVMFKMKDDPRITRIGKFIRRYSIDELPQLWNTLVGDMSLVGPRPALPSEVEQYGFDARRRLRVRPGLTGLWQVSGRSSLSWEETVRLDLYYVDNWSLVQDLIILLRTVKAVFGSSGAY